MSCRKMQQYDSIASRIASSLSLFRLFVTLYIFVRATINVHRTISTMLLAMSLTLAMRFVSFVLHVVMLYAVCHVCMRTAFLHII